jgi:hypothetical protein
MHIGKLFFSKGKENRTMKVNNQYGALFMNQRYQSNDTDRFTGTDRFTQITQNTLKKNIIFEAT